MTTTQQHFLRGTLAACVLGLAGPACAAATAPAMSVSPVARAQPFPGSKISLAPLPVEIYLQRNQKPAIAFTTPCMQLEKMTNGFPPILAFEQLMFGVIGKVNDSEILPVKLEPVCI